jgi:hypothetical protein
MRSKNDAQPLPARRYWAGDRCPVWGEPHLGAAVAEVGEDDGDQLDQTGDGQVGGGELLSEPA